MQPAGSSSSSGHEPHTPVSLENRFNDALSRDSHSSISTPASQRRAATIADALMSQPQQLLTPPASPMASKPATAPMSSATTLERSGGKQRSSHASAARAALVTRTPEPLSQLYSLSGCGGEAPHEGDRRELRERLDVQRSMVLMEQLEEERAAHAATREHLIAENEAQVRELDQLEAALKAERLAHEAERAAAQSSALEEEKKRRESESAAMQRELASLGAAAGARAADAEAARLEAERAREELEVTRRTLQRVGQGGKLDKFVAVVGDLLDEPVRASFATWRLQAGLTPSDVAPPADTITATDGGDAAVTTPTAQERRGAATLIAQRFEGVKARCGSRASWIFWLVAVLVLAAGRSALLAASQNASAAASAPPDMLQVGGRGTGRGGKSAGGGAEAVGRFGRNFNQKLDAGKMGGEGGARMGTAQGSRKDRRRGKDRNEPPQEIEQASTLGGLLAPGVLPDAPVSLALSVASWIAAAIGLRRAGWQWPLMGGALVALGVQEVVENIAALLGG
jgi:hypothetical protein